MRFVIIKFVAILSVFVLTSGLTTNAFANPPSAFDFVKPSENSSLEVSPDGRFIAYKQRKTNKYCLDRYGLMVPLEKSKCYDKFKEYRSTYVLGIYDLQKNEYRKIVPVPDNYYIGFLEFIGNDRLLMSISSRTSIGRGGAGYSLGSSRILSIDYSENADETKPFTVLFEDQKKLQRQNRYLSQVTDILRNDPEHIVMPAVRSGELDLWKVNVISGQADRIAIGASGTFYWFTDRDGNPSLRFDCRGYRCGKVDLYAPEEGQEKWKRIRTIRRIDKNKDEEPEFEFWPLAAAPKDDQYYVLSTEDKFERRTLKIFDVVKEEYVETIFEHPEVDVEGALFDLETGDYAGAYFYTDRLEYAIHNNQQQKHFDAINKYFDDEANISFSGYTKNGSKAVVFVQNHNTPGTYYLYDFKTFNIKEIISTEPSINGKWDSGARVITVPMRDGQTISAYHYYPTGQMKSGAPLLVMPHGGPESRDYFNYDYHVQYFVSRGYQVVQMNFRGSDGYGRKFAQAGYGEWGGLMQDDVTDTVKYFHDQGLATPDTTCIVGYSYGGYVALQGAVSTPELYNCVVSGAGLSDLMLSMKNEKKQHGKDSAVYKYFLKSRGDPKVDEEKLRNVSPVNFAERIVAPVLLIHGDEDENVDHEQSKVMNRALKKAGKDVEFITLKDEGHNGWSLDNEVLYLETIEAFLDKHLR